MADVVDIAVIGGGAAGLASAIFAAETRPGIRVVILDGAARLGAKILVSGGGRCNVTHDVVTPGDFCGPQHFVRHVLAAFDERAAVSWFESLGVKLKREETGKLFPVSDDAHTVLDALVRRCEALGVRILTGHRVRAVERAADGAFTVEHARGSLTARRVVLATGGRSLPKTGSDGHGFEVARAVGHSVTDTYPALVPLVLAGRFIHAGLSGLSCEVTLAIVAAGKRTDRRTGSLLWTHFGVSGPVVMDASRFWVIAQARGERPRIECCFLPGNEFADAERWLIDAAAGNPRESLSSLLAGRLPARLADALIRHSGNEPQQSVGQLPREKRRQLVHTLAALELPVLRDRGWNYAEVTAGGVPVAEVNHRSMESRRAPGLYLVGEILDVDGRIGGFNFQWAWSTGYVAGRAAAALSPPS